MIRFARGLEEALAVQFRMPETWPEPGDEREAKSQLGRLIRDGTGENLLRGGFEYADRIVARMPLEACKNVSLTHLAREFAAAVRRLGAAQ